MVFVCGLAVAGMPSPARATVIELNVLSLVLNIVVFIAARVDLTSSTTATIKFDSLPNDFIALMGGSGAVAVNVNATSWRVGEITCANAGIGFSPGCSNGGAGTEGDFGSFNQTINAFDGFTHSADTVSFTLINTEGTWSDDSSVLTPNSSGFMAAAHFFATKTPPDARNDVVAEAFGAGPVPVSEPATLFLIGSGLGAVAWRRKRRLLAPSRL